MMNNMNGIGINQMGMMNSNGMMNPFLMNNLMGMINQPNIINGINLNFDETAQNIKNIISPYENRIKELEEIIRQKDFEITVLKQKLNIINKNNINEIIMMKNINPNNMIIENINNINQQIKKDITVKIKFENNDIINVKCSEDDMASILYDKCNIKKHLSHDYKMIDSGKTIKENGITGDSELNVTSCFYNITYQKANSIYTISLNGNCPVGLSIILIFIKYNNIRAIIKVFNDTLLLFYNGRKLKISDNTPIRETFRVNSIPKIIIGEE